MFEGRSNYTEREREIFLRCLSSSSDMKVKMLWPLSKDQPSGESYRSGCFNSEELQIDMGVTYRGQ